MAKTPNFNWKPLAPRRTKKTEDKTLEEDDDYPHWKLWLIFRGVSLDGSSQDDVVVIMVDTLGVRSKSGH